jgi:CheY-like chemotaxis protein/HPt (histidine-containing phosphotransfer) domain-containing protein
MAADGAIALQMWQAKPGRYALLLSDCHMPHLDGFGLTQAIRTTEPVGTRLPIIAVTANAMQDEAQRCRERGMDDYLAKPLRMSALAPMLEKWLSASKPVPASVTSPAPAQPENGHPEPGLAESTEIALAPSFPIWNPASLTALVGDNPAMHKRLLVRFLASADAQVAEITAAAVAGDPATLGRVAHSLKSAARSVGAMRLGELCQDLETAGRAEDVQTCSAVAAGLPAVFAAAAVEINGHLGL